MIVTAERGGGPRFNRFEHALFGAAAVFAFEQASGLLPSPQPLSPIEVREVARSWQQWPYDPAPAPALEWIRQSVSASSASATQRFVEPQTSVIELGL
jgi:hypothetical protein